MAFVFALLFVMLHLLSPGEIFPSLAPYRILLILAVIAGLLTIPTLLQPVTLGRIRTQAFLLVMFFLWISGTSALHGWFGGVFAIFENLIPSLLVYFVGISQFHKPFRLSLVRLGLVVVALFILGMAISQIPEARATGAQTPYIMAGSSDEEIGVSDLRIRGLGMLHDPNFYGQFLLLILPLLFVGNKPEGLGAGYLIALALALVMVAGIYLTNSRGAQLGLLLLIALFLWKRFGKAGAVVALVAAPILVVVINATRGRTISISSGIDRLTLWSNGLGMFKSSPLWGIGYYEFGEREHLTAHNTYLLCAAEMGIIGLFIWMSLVVVTVLLLRRVPAAVGAADPVLARWANAILLSLYGYLFTSFFLSRLYDLPLYLLIGMAGGVISSAGGEDKISLRGTNWPVWAAGLSVGSLALIYGLVRMRMVG